jgi:tRNA pseudouridine32 synthase / 23S rRNA pseudouridine746 synthase
MVVHREKSKAAILADALAEAILFIDGEGIIIDKPSGLPVNTPRAGGLSVEIALKGLKIGFQRPPQIVHRLDQDTSGCLLLARNPKAQKRFNASFEAGTVVKRYLAILDGIPGETGGLIDFALGKISSEKDGWRMVADPAGKPARTHWSVLQTVKDRALVEFRPETGRTHQLRVHAATGLGIPIWGDPVYGRGQGAMLLHASFLSVARGDKPPAEATAPLPPSFAALGFVL